MLGTPILLPMSLVTLDNIYFCHLLHIQHHKQLWQWLWMSLAILGTKGTEDQPVHCLCEIRLWLFCLEHLSYHPSVTGSMASGCCSHHFGIWKEGGFLGNTTGNQHPTGHALWPEGTLWHNVKVLAAQDSYLRTDSQGPRPQTSQ